MMPAGGILITVFAAWVMKRQFSHDELFGGQNNLAYRVWRFLVSFVAPTLLAYVLFDMATS